MCILRNWPFGASERWRCPRAHLVVVMYLVIYLCMNVFFEHSRVSLVALMVFRLQSHMTCEA